MFKKWFGNNSPTSPTILGLRIGGSFEVDPLMWTFIEDKLVVSGCASTQIIQAAGIVQLDDTYLFRFYTDDEAFLQVVTQGGKEDVHVIDVKLFHYYDTLDIGSEHDWNKLLNSEIGVSQYQLEGHQYNRIWTSTGDYHNPVAMTETTFDSQNQTSSTDQFTMLFERQINDQTTESLFLSAEESFDDNEQLSRCLVISTGITLTPAQITIHG